MIPTILNFVDKTSWGKLLAHDVQTNNTAVNITSITYLGYQTSTAKYTWRITLAAWTAAKWANGMDALLAGTANHNGTHPIIGLDAVTGTIDIATDIEPVVGAGGAAGTIAPSGIAPYNHTVTPAATLVNNHGDLIGYGYATSQSFITKIDGKENEPAIQVSEYGGLAGLTVTIRWSIDGVNWIAFPTAITTVAVGAGAAGGWLLTQAKFNDIWIRIDVVATATATYYVLIK